MPSNTHPLKNKLISVAISSGVITKSRLGMNKKVIENYNSATFSNVSNVVQMQVMLRDWFGASIAEAIVASKAS